jgi:hypothetical protein
MLLATDSIPSPIDLRQPWLAAESNRHISQDNLGGGGLTLTAVIPGRHLCDLVERGCEASDCEAPQAALRWPPAPLRGRLS